ncbi:MAG: SUMF1/EgtB/PvdO family nonheme iron enzyme [Chlamydiales bacterium]|nr:SUMF1/EgtB/PvdO family nonheme iron enzyme [Chlamydiales bacterium]
MSRNILGDYEIIKEMEKGPLGSVFLVEHRFIKRRFILKLLPTAINADSEFLHRFKKHIQDIALLTHPNIVKLHNVSEAGGKYFLVTDSVLTGEQPVHLGDYVKANQHRMGEKDYLHILSQVAKALDYAHEKNVVHGMLKPSNILIKESSHGIDVLVSDFGLASIVGEGYLLSHIYKNMAAALSIHFDEAGTKEDILPALHQSFLTSYHFLSVEQKKNQMASPASDVYAFGVLTYWLLTKEYPEGIPSMPSKINSSLLLLWDELIKGCMQKDPQKRPISIAKALDDISYPQLEEYQTKEEDYTRQVSIEDLSHMRITTPKLAPVRKPDETDKRSITETVEETPPLSMEQPPQDRYKGSIADRLQPKLQPTQQIRPSASIMTKPVVEKTLKPILEPQKLQKPTYETDPIIHLQSDVMVAPYKPQEKEEKIIEPLLSEMMVLKGGAFYRGSNEGARDERPAHKVHVDSFAIDIHPVTNEQFVRFLEVMSGEKDHNNNDIIRLRDSRIHRNAGRYVIESGYTKHPVVGVTWYGATAYAKWVGKRLPFEAEWEVAARSMKDATIYPTGFEISKDQANYFSSDTTPICTYPANAIGLYDMAGNVYEWCDDWYDYTYYELSHQEPQNPKGPHQGVYRVLRGGCWKSLKDDLRCSHRHRNNPGATNNMYGFRCASNVS